MRKYVFLLSTITLFMALNLGAQNTLTNAERESAINHLTESLADIEKTVHGLSEAQLNFKASDEAWSIAECIEHIAISETALFGIVEGSLQNEPDSSLRGEVKMTDEQIVGFIEDRSTRVKTQQPFEPTNKFESYEGSLKAFSTKRAENIKFVKTSEEDLRNRYFDFPFGKLDSYQVVLFISGHSIRHLKQIKEVMANEGFPKS